jgi:hypothetical protein
MEHWNDGIMGQKQKQKEFFITQYSNIPSFHSSLFDGCMHFDINNQIPTQLNSSYLLDAHP